jgi:hypothetical protein
MYRLIVAGGLTPALCFYNMGNAPPPPKTNDTVVSSANPVFHDQLSNRASRMRSENSVLPCLSMSDFHDPAR